MALWRPQQCLVSTGPGEGSESWSRVAVDLFFPLISARAVEAAGTERR